MNEYYEGYLLDGIAVWQLSDDIKEELDACIFLVDNTYSLRVVERNTGISRSKLSRFINNQLKSISFELWQCCKHQLSRNKVKYFKTTYYSF